MSTQESDLEIQSKNEIELVVSLLTFALKEVLRFFFSIDPKEKTNLFYIRSILKKRGKVSLTVTTQVGEKESIGKVIKRNTTSN